MTTNNTEDFDIWLDEFWKRVEEEEENEQRILQQQQQKKKQKIQEKINKQEKKYFNSIGVDVYVNPHHHSTYKIRRCDKP